MNPIILLINQVVKENYKIYEMRNKSKINAVL